SRLDNRLRSRHPAARWYVLPRRRQAEPRGTTRGRRAERRSISQTAKILPELHVWEARLCQVLGPVDTINFTFNSGTINPPVLMVCYFLLAQKKVTKKAQLFPTSREQ